MAIDNSTKAHIIIPKGTALIDLDLYRAFRKKMNVLMEKRKPGNAIWDFCYEVGRLVFDSRWAILHDDFMEFLEDNFSPQNFKERRLLSHVAYKILFEKTGNHIMESADEITIRQIYTRAQQTIKDGSWKRIDFGPKSTPKLHKMFNDCRKNKVSFERQLVADPSVN